MTPNISPINYNAIPNELKLYNNWCLWKFETKENGELTKVPYQLSGYKCDSTNPSHWSSFDAIANYKTKLNGHSGYDGIGFVFSDYDPFCGIDLDFTENQEWFQRQLKVYNNFNSYSEFSPSGRGIHIIVYGSVPQGRKREKIEVYSTGRFFTFTGQVYNNAPIANRQELLDILWAEMGPPPVEFSVAKNKPQILEDIEILRRATAAVNGERFTKLYTGEWQELYPSQSEADFAMIDMFAFYTQNIEQIKRLWSGCQLSKRNKQTTINRVPYLDHMINRAMDRQLPEIDISQLKAEFEAMSARTQEGPTPGNKADPSHDSGDPRDQASLGSANSGEASTHSSAAVANMNGSSSSVNPQWPDGMLGEIAQFIYMQAAHPVYEIALGGAIAFMSGICGKAYNISDTGLNQYVLILAGTGCHAKGTKILMYDGTFKLVEDVQIGDVLLGPDSQPRIVKSLARGRQEMVRINPIKGSSFVVNKDHILHLHKTASDNVRKNITVRDWISSNQKFKHLHKLVKSNCVEFSKKSDPVIDPWFLGALLGDGHYTSVPTITGMDKAIHDKSIECAKKLGCIVGKIYKNPHNKAWQTSFVGKYFNSKNPLSEHLKELGVFGKRAAEKFIPFEYKTGSVETRRQILAGLIDTDGCHSKNCCYIFVSKSKQLADDVTFVARSLGLFASIKQTENYSQNGTGGFYYRVELYGDLDQIPVVLERKKAGKRQQKKNHLVTGFSHEELPEDDYYGFHLDKDHLYMTDDFTIHHNSNKEAAASGISKLMNEIRVSVPNAIEFMGPGDIKSDAGLIKWLDRRPCFLSIVGEFGLRFKQMISTHGHSYEEGIKRVMLDLYNKSGKNDILNPLAYSDKEKNTSYIKAPSFSLLGEGVPETFYTSINEETIIDGLLPRFLIIEYKGYVPAFNKNRRNVKPPKSLVDNLCTLIGHNLANNQNNVVTDVEISYEAEILFDQLKEKARTIINNNKENVRQLWNRAHIKALKLAAIETVGINPWQPIINEKSARWAIDFVINDIENISKKVNLGQIGEESKSSFASDDNQLKELVKIIGKWARRESLPTEKADDKMLSMGVFPIAALQTRVGAIACYRKDRIGSGNAFKRALQLLLDSGDIQELNPTQITEQFGKKARCFKIVDYQRFLDS